MMTFSPLSPTDVTPSSYETTSATKVVPVLRLRVHYLEEMLYKKGLDLDLVNETIAARLQTDDVRRDLKDATKREESAQHTIRELNDRINAIQRHVRDLSAQRDADVDRIRELQDTQASLEGEIVTHARTVEKLRGVETSLRDEKMAKERLVQDLRGEIAQMRNNEGEYIEAMARRDHEKDMAIKECVALREEVQRLQDVVAMERDQMQHMQKEHRSDVEAVRREEAEVRERDRDAHRREVEQAMLDAERERAALMRKLRELEELSVAHAEAQKKEGEAILRMEREDWERKFHALEQNYEAKLETEQHIVRTAEAHSNSMKSLNLQMEERVGRGLIESDVTEARLMAVCRLFADVREQGKVDAMRLQSTVRVLEERLERATSDAYDAERQHRAQCDELRTSVARERDAVVHLENKTSILSSRLASADSDVTTFREKVSHLSEEVSALQSREAQSRSDITHLINENNNLIATHENMQQQLVQFQSSVDRQKTFMHDLAKAFESPGDVVDEIQRLVDANDSNSESVPPSARTTVVRIMDALRRSRAEEQSCVAADSAAVYDQIERYSCNVNAQMEVIRDRVERRYADLQNAQFSFQHVRRALLSAVRGIVELRRVYDEQCRSLDEFRQAQAQSDRSWEDRDRAYRDRINQEERRCEDLATRLHSVEGELQGMRRERDDFRSKYHEAVRRFDAVTTEASELRRSQRVASEDALKTLRDVQTVVETSGSNIVGNALRDHRSCVSDHLRAIEGIVMTVKENQVTPGILEGIHNLVLRSSQELQRVHDILQHVASARQGHAKGSSVALDSPRGIRATPRGASNSSSGSGPSDASRGVTIENLVAHNERLYLLLQSVHEAQRTMEASVRVQFDELRRVVSETTASTERGISAKWEDVVHVVQRAVSSLLGASQVSPNNNNISSSNSAPVLGPHASPMRQSPSATSSSSVLVATTATPTAMQRGGGYAIPSGLSTAPNNNSTHPYVSTAYQPLTTALPPRPTRAYTEL